MAVPAASWLETYRAWAAPEEKRIRITAIKVLQLDNIPDGCLIRVETDAGVVGYGEGMGKGKVLRGQLEQMQGVWMGADPLAIETMFYKLMAPQNISRHVGMASGVNIALWDIAGKVIGQPVYRLMGGPLRPSAPVYTSGQIRNMLDPGEAKAWAQKVKAAPEGIKVFKFGITLGDRGGPEGPYINTADHYDLKKIGKGFENVRNAAGDDLDIAMHGLGQFDLPTAIGLARAIESIDPAWFEDPLDYVYSDAWKELKRSTRTPILAGERINLLAEFKPYLDNTVLNVIHPDPAFAGGITGVKRIADYAALTRVPVACHSGPCGLPRFYASLHLALVIQNFFRVENLLGESRGFKEKMALPGTELVVRNGSVVVPTRPGLGLEFNEDYLREHTAKGEPHWA
jgi:L-alanine-DL-glutamate epimerase-like enolase superfamily enzyme